MSPSDNGSRKIQAVDVWELFSHDYEAERQVIYKALDLVIYIKSGVAKIASIAKHGVVEINHMGQLWTLG